ncbi:hypothetical protein [Ructibacterium gallinarum]|nr:hypothetical protein [Ructibacterium gallinarum]
MTNQKKNSEKGRRRRELMQNFSKDRRSMSILYIILTCIVLGVLVGQFFSQNYENCFTCILTLILFLIPSFVDRKLKITLPHTLEVIIVLFIFSAEILGEIRAFYLKISWWDTMLHTMNGFLMAAVGVSMVDIFNQSERFKFELSPFFVALVAFCFSMTIGVLWEFFEFGMDALTLTDMQKDTVLNTIATVNLNPDGENIPIVIRGIEDVIAVGQNMTVNENPESSYAFGLGGYLDVGIYDTMKDLIVNFIGAIAFSVIGFFYIKSRGKGTFAQRFIPRLKRHMEASDLEQKHTERCGNS